VLYTLLKFLGWGILLALLGGCIGWALRSLKCRGEVARVRATTVDSDEVDRMRHRLANMDQIVAERNRLRMQVADMRHADSPGVVHLPGEPQPADDEPAASSADDAADPVVDDIGVGLGNEAVDGQAAPEDPDGPDGPDGPDDPGDLDGPDGVGVSVVDEVPATDADVPGGGDDADRDDGGREDTGDRDDTAPVVADVPPEAADHVDPESSSTSPAGFADVGQPAGTATDEPGSDMATSQAEDPNTARTDAPVLDLSAATAVLGKKIRLDDLSVVEGIGPKISELCRGIGIETWRQLANTDVPTLQSMLDAAGSRFQVHKPGTWPTQAGLLADGRWEEFKQTVEELEGGR
jgi:predicted flap endonuclease-1-like 5' DNA nuclease